MNKTLVCVTDGSYQKEKAPNLCSAGWIMACKKTEFAGVHIVICVHE